ncbi:MAG: hypothetical protein GY856_45095, partial [bacterium]|nr:hypothetical protein [bacterium]
MEYDPIPDLSRPPGESENLGRLRLPQQDPPHKTTRRRLVTWVLVPAIAVILAMAAGVVTGSLIQKPEVDQLDEYKPRLVTELHDRNGQVFQTYSRENRILIEENELPLLLQQAIVAAEDSNFFQHGGIDLKGIVRAATKNLAAGRKKEGASTITMQLARELFLHRKRTWGRKIEEALLAVELEKKYSKQQILTLYANLVNLSHGNYGMEAAAQDYFNKSVDELTLAEAATLAGIPQRPSHFSIRYRPEEVKGRRNYVLGRMEEEGFITPEECEQAKAEPILVVTRRREAQLGPYLAEDVRRFLMSTFGETAVYDRGLQVHTTLDRDIQRAAEGALRDGLLRLDHRRGWRGAKDHLDDEDLESRELPSWTGHEPIPGEWYEGIVLKSDRKIATVRIDEGVYELTRRGIEWTRRSRPSTLLQRGDVAWFRLQLPEEEGKQEEVAEPILMLEQEPELEGA